VPSPPPSRHPHRRPREPRVPAAGRGVRRRARRYLLLTHSTLDLDTDGAVTRAVARYRAAGISSYMRSRDQVAGLFLDGLGPLEPGLVPTPHWRAVADVADGDVSAHAVVARKP
jgi:hypothetical protein